MLCQLFQLILINDNNGVKAVAVLSGGFFECTYNVLCSSKLKTEQSEAAGRR
jgi:hypothetical protein